MAQGHISLSLGSSDLLSGLPSLGKPRRFSPRWKASQVTSTQGMEWATAPDDAPTPIFTVVMGVRIGALALRFRLKQTEAENHAGSSRKRQNLVTSRQLTRTGACLPFSAPGSSGPLSLRLARGVGCAARSTAASSSLSTGIGPGSIDARVSRRGADASSSSTDTSAPTNAPIEEGSD
jgi:hypothetical protein